uniref:Aquaporin NIP7-1 n=2 Tax=Nelumbo nucifera TaxID=4432 RepID=A0A822XGC0_NELNU|nr:TPA_asm: hypothetical protein HUJ06_020903 [Nelumbo nucifera]
MKPLVKEPSPSVYSNEAHPTKQSQGDPESGAHTITSSSGDARTSDHCFPWWRTNLNSIRMVLAEMIGTFILMFCVCGIIAGRELTKGDMGLLEYAATGGLSVTILMFCVGPISGGHLNPSVTIAFATVGHFPWSKVPLYISAQMVGSVFATYVGESVYGIKADILTTRPLQSRATAFWAELMATSITLFLASSLCHQAHAVAQASGFVVGIAIALAVLITG